MTKEIWINLPVKNMEASRKFFSAIGFSFNDKHANPDMTCMLVGDKKVAVMLFSEHMFGSFIQHGIADTKLGSEVLLSVDAETRQEVDEVAAKAERAGGKVFGKPTEIQGWMYGCGFSDLDGHRWNFLYRDMNHESAK